MKTFNFSSWLMPTVAPSRRTKTQFPIKSYLSGMLEKFWQSAVSHLAGQMEPQVWQKTDKYGNTYWRAYDPANDSYFSGSEADMRRWIEQRYSV